MNKTKLFLLALMAIVVAACATDTVDGGAVSAETAVAKKLLNTSVGAMQGELIIYVDEATADHLAGVEVATRSGLTEMDAVAEELSATDLRPVFNLKVNSTQKREMGMHRWFVMNFPENADLERAALRLAEVKAVERVQFSKQVERPTAVPIEVDLSEVAQTRSEEYPFDDPMLPLQWHYRNLGNEATFPGVKAGADANIFPAWEHTAGRSDIIVAVVDEGVCYSHVDLKDNMCANQAELNGEDGVDEFLFVHFLTP